MPGSLGNQRHLGCCHVQSNAGGGEASWLGHYALALPSVELQDKSEGGKKQKRRERRRYGRERGRGRGLGRGRALETASSDASKHKIMRTEVHPD